MTHIAMTKDGRVLTGLLGDSTADTITLVDAKNQRTVLKRTDLEALKESPVSLMPEKLLDELTDQQIRDLVAYVQSEDNPRTRTEIQRAERINTRSRLLNESRH